MGAFTIGIRAFSRKTLERHEHVRRGVCLKLFAAIIRDTPVLTGALRANWITSIHNPDITTSHGKQTSLAVALLTDKVMASQPSDVVIITNRLPYCSRIEYEGWSKVKAPQGMVRRNIARFRQLISSELHTLS